MNANQYQVTIPARDSNIRLIEALQRQ
jgi:hypothetical protein